MKIANLFEGIPAQLAEEKVDRLLTTSDFILERIVSIGHVTAAGEWFDQERDEWVILLSGRAILLFADEAEAQRLEPGDFIHIPAHRRHRVEWTDPGEKTVWLALHFTSEKV